ncbi:MAG: TetR/AcrR family transcriptional regulator [Magnetococcales bacterium]|nr:TetR/AcrR family transcriptional regulator [Magnetococcales bacterium]
MGNRATKGKSVRRKQRHERILKAMMRLLEKGERKISTSDLVDEADVSKSHLNRHFKGREGVYLALVDRIEEHFLPREEVWSVGFPEPLQRLQAMFQAHIKFFTDNPGLCRVFLVEGIIPGLAARKMVDVNGRVMVHVKEVLDEARSGGSISEDVSSSAAAQMFMSLVQSRALTIMHPGTRKTAPDSGWQEMWTLFSHAVLFTDIRTDSDDSAYLIGDERNRQDIQTEKSSVEKTPPPETTSTDSRSTSPRHVSESCVDSTVEQLSENVLSTTRT